MDSTWNVEVSKIKLYDISTVSFTGKMNLKERSKSVLGGFQLGPMLDLLLFRLTHQGIMIYATQGAAGFTAQLH